MTRKQSFLCGSYTAVVLVFACSCLHLMQGFLAKKSVSNRLKDVCHHYWNISWFFLLFLLRLNKDGTLCKSYCFYKVCVHQSNKVFILNIDASLFQGQCNQSCGHCHRDNFKPDNSEAGCGHSGQHNECKAICYACILTASQKQSTISNLERLQY